MVRRLSLGKNNHLTYASLALNPRYDVGIIFRGYRYSKNAAENLLYFFMPDVLKNNTRYHFWYIRNEQIMTLFSLFQSDENSGFYGNLMLPLTY